MIEFQVLEVYTWRINDFLYKKKLAAFREFYVNVTFCETFPKTFQVVKEQTPTKGEFSPYWMR